MSAPEPLGSSGESLIQGDHVSAASHLVGPAVRVSDASSPRDNGDSPVSPSFPRALQLRLDYTDADEDRFERGNNEHNPNLTPSARMVSRSRLNVGAVTNTGSAPQSPRPPVSPGASKQVRCFPPPGDPAAFTDSFSFWDMEEPDMPQDQKRRFLLHLVVSLHSYGDTTHRTEYLIAAVADKLGVRADIGAFPNFVLVSFLSPDGDPTKSELHHLPISGGLDLDKLGRVDAVCQGLVAGKIDAAHAWERVNNIAHAPPCFPLWVQILSYPLSGFSCALTFFGGGLIEAGVATLCAALVGLIVLLGTWLPTLNRVMEFVCAFFVGFLTRALTGADPTHGCFVTIALSALVWFLPGFSITQSVMEISSRSMISGVARLVYAVSIALQLGFGMALGSELAWWADPLISTTCEPISRLWHILSFFGVAASFNVLLNANLRQWPGMTFASAVGLLISEFGAELDPNLITMLAALGVGLVGMVMARYSHHHQNALTIILSGILMLVPGSVGLRGVTALLQQNTVSGVQFGFSMLLIALSIAIGLLVARMAANTPVRRVHTPQNLAHDYSRLMEMPPI